MDPLSAIGLASSIVQFVQFGLLISNRLQEIASNDVPQCLRSISTQLPLLLNALSRIQSSPSLQTLDFDTRCILKGMIAGCMEQVKTVEKMIIEITPKEGESFKAKIKKVFTSLKYDEKVWAVERNLQTYIQVLILHHVIDEKDVPDKLGEEAFFDVREKRVQEFVEREKLMGELEERLRDVVWGKTKDPTILMIAGEKGVGKTQLVLEYVHRSHELGQFRTVFWIDAFSLENLNLGFESTYATIKRTTDGSRQEKIRFVKEFLNDLWHPWLLVLDNYESHTLYNEIMDFLPTQGYGGILLLTHQEDANGLGSTIKVPKFIPPATQSTLNSLLTQEVQRKSLDGIKDLVSQGANPDSLIWNEWPCLHRCALFGLNDAVSFLLAEAANPNPPDLRIRKPVYWASSSGSLAVVQTLLDHEDKIGIYTTLSDIQSSFSAAAEEGHLPIMKLLLSRRGVNLNSKNQYDETVLQTAAKKGHFEIVEFLISEGVLSEDHIQGEQTLLNASSSNHFDIVKLLITKGKLSPNILDAQGMTPLSFASQSRDDSYTSNGISLVQFLLEQGADPNLASKSSGGPLNEAAVYGHVEIAKLLLEHGADPMKDSGGWDPLTNAIKYKCPSIIDLLLETKIENKDARKQWLENSLRYAVRSDDRATVLKILKKGVDINTTSPTSTPKSATPLLLATLSGHVKMAQFLLRQKSDQTIPDEKGRVPLGVAVENGYEVLVRDLIKAGGDRDLRVGEDEDSLLMVAVSKGREGVVRVLLEMGADREVCNRFGDGVEDVAGERGDEGILKLLEGWVVT